MSPRLVRLPETPRLPPWRCPRLCACAASRLRTTWLSYVAKGTAAADANGGPVAIDEDGLPLVYDKAAIQAFWANQGGALQKRWGEFIGLSVPFLTRVATLSITGGAEELSRNDRSLARDARIIIEKLARRTSKPGR